MGQILRRIAVMFWHVIFFIMLVSYCEAGSCDMSDCVCTDTYIHCKEDNMKLPRFTMLERFYTTNLELTKTQKGLLAKVCEMFPNIDELMYTGDECPYLACVKEMTCK